MAVRYEHHFHGVVTVMIGPEHVCGTGSEAFATRDLMLYGEDGEPVVVKLYGKRGGKFELPVTLIERGLD